MFKQKFDYKSYDRKEINGIRKYVTPGGILPSVTTVLGEVSDKTALNEWRKRVGEEKANQISREASGVGTRMHKFLEDYVISGEFPAGGSNPYSRKANSMARVIKNNALDDIDEFWGLEVPLYVPHLYAGTTDVVAVYKGNPCICDYKQANKKKKEEWVVDYKIQLVAYSEAHNELYNTNIREGHVFMCTRDLEYQQFDVWPNEYDYWKNKWYDNLYSYYQKNL